MNSNLIILTLLHCLFLQIGCECLTEDDLDFESCDLVHLPNEALNDICERIGLDLEGHVIPVLLGIDEDEEAGVGEIKERMYTHDDYVRGAEECLMIEDEVNRLQEENPDYLEELEREALLDDPEIFADMITKIISQDESLLKEISAKLSEDEELMTDAEKLLEENETLENRPDVLGFLLAKYLSEDPSLLDEFDELFQIEDEIEIIRSDENTMGKEPYNSEQKDEL